MLDTSGWFTRAHTASRSPTSAGSDGAIAKGLKPATQTRPSQT